MPLTEPQVRVLRAMQQGAALTAHFRPGRGPFHTLGGRRLGIVLLKELESQRLIARSGEGAGRGAAGYALTAVGEAALAGWEAGRGPGKLDLP
ncbi:hypothetical protein [Deinococcus budaensis]|uniref:MarR family transcriptional regulator n=1 Tax=Deinococcus budaensis TaxID=1665626 RepID=A0A7W8GC64_9DEIO|nr:hypothetical protein [Deinococcus budaensis]MBB5232703.1 hypothetical protein [Deinococcus budaensis]